MDIEDFLKIIQRWTNNVPLIILGSGASVPFSLPSMWTLGEYLKNNITFSEAKDNKQFEEFVKIFNQTEDLERALSDLNLSSSVLTEIVNKTWESVNKADLKAYEQFISNQIHFPLVELIEHLLSSAGRKASIITTNYDRLAEYAASFAKGVICTGYNQNYIGHFSNVIHKNNLKSLKGYSGQVNIWKVHGSLDWFKTENEENVQLPLRHSIPKNYIPSIVTPGLSKYFQTHQEPYRTIFTEADSEIENATGFLCIGYGFNDLHVQPKLTNQIRKGKPIIVITKELTPKTKQTIIDNKCPNYILIEEDKNNPKNSRIFSSKFNEEVIENVKYWELSQFINLIK
ncbi:MULTISPECIES: SIR2 family protein [unclassified Tenacibaculum]|uniref:SIR2 family protein n=1 Tax=unclassified Tenacibaculum TaxID=2635139 RepID=UPI001F3569AB|nr:MULTISPECIES: SIR2 family protein [unclassified Tenacibaculum]MCF2875574.1 SIR2 family protein [Tenacibaculum sp. Cn5-1]MCF2935650.1 SIR2 family protein [Tenacibaculum sp. Cn5-34]MCG7512210.1 SIR2 family protein [Tenacibaculum sp. Cn5-46]